MATWHTDNLLGNDTTGNGTAALPYKTITKAYSVAAANDTIKVAGSTLSDVPGLTLSCNGGNSFVYTANIDPTGLIAPGDCISLTDPLWGADKFFFRVVSMTGTLVTLSSPSLPSTAMSVRKFNSIHYATSSTGVIFETGTTQPNNIQLLGGWNSDFTLQNGWTVVRFQNASVNSTSCVFINASGTGTLTYRDKFAFFNLTTAFPGGTANEYYGDMIFVRVQNMMGAYPQTNRSDVKWHVIYSNVQAGTTTVYNTNGTYGLSIDEFYRIIFPTANIGITNVAFNCNKLYMQSNATATDMTTTNTGLFASSIGGSYGDIYVNNVVNADLYIRVQPTSNNVSYEWNGRLFMPTLPFVLITNNAGWVVWNNPTQNVSSDFKYWATSSSNPFWLNPGTIYAYDSEGTKVSQNGNNFQYVDTTTYLTGTNSLRSTRTGRPTASGQYGMATIGQFRVNSGTTRIDITITAKNDNATNITEYFRLWSLGFLPSSFPSALQTARGINTSWNTWTWTITNADAINSLKNSLVILSWYNAFSTTSKYLWVDDVVITQS